MIRKASQPLPEDISPIERELAAAVMAAVRAIKDQTVVADVARAIEAGDVQGALDSIRVELGEHALNALIPRQLRTAYEQAAEAQQRMLAEALKIPQVSIRFDIVNPEAVAFIREHAAELIREWGTSSLEAIRALIQASFTEGITPTKLARLIMDSGIGLTQRQIEAIQRFRQGLIEAGKSEAQIERMVARMAQRALRYRAEMIARTEIIRASREGSQALWRQAQEAGLIGSGAMQEWLTAEDERTCLICEPLDHVKVPLDEQFPGEGGDGPPAHPQCRCALRLIL